MNVKLKFSVPSAGREMPSIFCSTQGPTLTSVVVAFPIAFYVARIAGPRAKGILLVSVLLRPSTPMPIWPELSLVAGEAVARAVGAGAVVSHPNDVMIAGRKVAGVLPEATRGRVVLGIGVNVNHTADELPRDTVKPTTSLRVALGREVDRAELLPAILLELERCYDAWDARYRR